MENRNEKENEQSVVLKKINIPKDIKPYTITTVMALIQEYFELSNKYQQEYGTNTILLMQVGSFFEVYGNKTQRIIDDFTRICKKYKLKEYI